MDACTGMRREIGRGDTKDESVEREW